MDYAINIRLEALDQASEAATFDMLLKVFNKFRLSFRNYIEVEFRRNPGFLLILKKKPRVLDDFKKETDLEFVQLDIDSLCASIAPDIFDKHAMLFHDDILCWKQERFSEFRERVIFCDYHDTEYVKSLIKTYTPEERKKIWQPYFDVISYDKKYKVSIIDTSGKPAGMLVPPHDVIRQQLLAPAEQSL